MSQITLNDISRPTDYTYTGQRSRSDEFGLIYYNAQWYDLYLKRMGQPDSIIPNPGNPQDYDRYSYVRNNSVRYHDPTGHWAETAVDIAGIVYDIYEIQKDGLGWVNGLALAADVACAVLPVAVGGGLMVRTAAHADDVVDATRAADKLFSLSDEAIEAGRKISDELLDRIHHIATNKNYKAGQRWSNKFESLLLQGGLEDILSLNRQWNKVKIPKCNERGISSRKR